MAAVVVDIVERGPDASVEGRVDDDEVVTGDAILK